MEADRFDHGAVRDAYDGGIEREQFDGARFHEVERREMRKLVATILSNRQRMPR